MTIAQDRIDLYTNNRALLEAAVIAMPNGPDKAALLAMLADPTVRNAIIAVAYLRAGGGGPQ